MLLSKGIFNIHSTTSQTSKAEQTRFRFPEVRTRRRSSTKSQSEDPPLPKEQDKPKSVHKADGLRNVLSILALALAIKFSLSTAYSIPLPNLPELNKVLPSQIAKPYFYIYLFPAIGMFGALFIERQIAEDKIPLLVANTLHSCTIVTGLMLPLLVREQVSQLEELIANLFFTLTHLVLAFKMISFVQINRKMKENAKASNNNDNPANYPENLTMKEMLLFWLSPHIVYKATNSEDNQGAQVSRRVGYIVYRIAELLILSLIFRYQFLVISEICEDLSKSVSVVFTVERFLCLSVAYMLTWATCFHVLFNSFLPLMAEVSGARERTFYLDWWNSASMDQFWRKWNLPVHRWCVHHIYLPLVSVGFSKLTGVMVTFLFSAVLHEFLISVPICICGHFAFVTFLSQGIFCKISSWWTKKFGPTAGNILVWIALIFGNSTGVLIYYQHAVHSSH